MGHLIHPNQLPEIQRTMEEEEIEEKISGSMSAALRFLEGIDFDQDSLRRRRRRRAERAAAANVSCIAARTYVTR